MGPEEVEDGQDLAVVGHQGLTDGIGASDEGLQDLESDSNDFSITGVEGSYNESESNHKNCPSNQQEGSNELTLNRDDKLRNNGENLGTALLEHIEDTLNGQEAVGVDLLTDALKEDGQVVVVVELLDLNLPEDAVLRTMLNGDGEITAVVEAAELRDRDSAAVQSTSSGLLN